LRGQIRHEFVRSKSRLFVSLGSVVSSTELTLWLYRSILTTDGVSSHGLLGADLVGEGLVRSLLLSREQGVLSNFKEFESFREGESCKTPLPKFEVEHA